MITWIRSSPSVISAVLVLVATMLGGLGMWGIVKSIKSAVVAHRDLQWQSQLTKQRDAADVRAAEADRKAADALATARAAVESRDAEQLRVQELEAALARSTSDPMIWNRDLVRELRK